MYIYTRVIQKLLSLTQILGLSNTSHLYMGLTRTKIKKSESGTSKTFNYGSSF